MLKSQVYMNTAVSHTPVLRHLFPSLRREENRSSAKHTRSAYLPPTHMPRKSKQNFLAAGCSLPGWWEQLLLLFGVWSVVDTGGLLLGKTGEDRRETKWEPGQQEPSASANPTILARIVLGHGGLSPPWVSVLATMLTSVQSSATN